MMVALTGTERLSFSHFVVVVKGEKNFLAKYKTIKEEKIAARKKKKRKSKKGKAFFLTL